MTESGRTDELVRRTHSLDSRCTVQGCPECDHAPTPESTEQEDQP